jgi:hypothetical protein
MLRLFVGVMWALGATWSGESGVAHAQHSAHAGAAPVETVAHKKKRRTVKAAPAVERAPSGETVADRERRLRRECKGRPNAGACLGLTQ